METYAILMTDYAKDICGYFVNPIFRAVHSGRDRTVVSMLKRCSSAGGAVVNRNTSDAVGLDRITLRFRRRIEESPYYEPSGAASWFLRPYLSVRDRAVLPAILKGEYDADSSTDQDR